MKYLTGFTTESSAKDYSKAIAENQGCHGDITEYWFEVIKHKDRNEWAFVVPEGEENKLTTEEQARLQTFAELAADGWFPNPPIPE